MRTLRVNKGVFMKSKLLSNVSHVLVCGDKSCKKESKGLRKALAKASEETQGRVLVLKTACLGCSAKGPAVVVWPKGICFQEATTSDVAAILAAAGWTAPAVSPSEGGGKPIKKKAVKPIEKKAVKTAVVEKAKKTKRPAKAEKAE